MSHLHLASSFNTRTYPQMFRQDYNDPHDSTEREMARFLTRTHLRRAGISQFYLLEDHYGASLYLKTQTDAEKFEIARDIPDDKMHGIALETEFSDFSIRTIKKRLKQVERKLDAQGHKGRFVVGLTDSHEQVFLAADKDTHIALVPLHPLQYVLFG